MNSKLIIEIDRFEHFNVLYAHGISHLLGFDHVKDEDYIKMSAFEKKLLKEYPKYMSKYDPLDQAV